MLVLEGARSEMIMCEIQGSAEGAAIEVSGKKSRWVFPLLFLMWFTDTNAFTVPVLVVLYPLTTESPL